MCVNVSYLSYRSYQIGFLDAEFTCGTDAGSLWQKLCDSACFQQSMVHEYFEVMISIPEVETCFPRSFECSTLHSSCLVPGESWWCLAAAVRTLRTCFCCHLTVCFFQGLHRAGPTSHVHCRCWMMLNDSEYHSISIQYHSISIQYLHIYIYM